jgi:integrase
VLTASAFSFFLWRNCGEMAFRDETRSMGRPPAEIRVQATESGRCRVSFIETPGKWYMTPEAVKNKALAWAKRNKGHLIEARQTLALSPFMAGFFAPSGAWVERRRAKGAALSDKILGDYQAHITRYLDPLFGSADPRELTARQIDDALLRLKTPTGRELTGATKRKILHTMSVILGDLAEQGIIQANPLLGVKPYSKAPTRPRQALPRPVLVRLFPASHGAAVKVWGRSLWASLFGVMFDTGMRPGEVRALRWAEINRKESAIVIRHAVESATLSTIKTTKTGNVRAGRLSERTLQELEIWRAESQHGDDLDFIFTLDGSAPVTDAAIGQAFKRGLDAVKAGPESNDWTPYCLRHSFVTYSLASLDVREVALLAGHSEQIAKAVYAHPDDEIVLANTRAARKKLGGRES